MQKPYTLSIGKEVREIWLIRDLEDCGLGGTETAWMQ